jgi:hypothetical protein
VSKPKTTPWFRASIKPVRKGWYQVRGSFYETHGRIGVVWRYWSGKSWRWKSPSYCELTSALVIPGEDMWRGLAAPPKTENKHA